MGARRIQRRRRRGWRMPSDAVYVGRPTVWGNPFAVTRSSDYHGLAGSWFLRGPDGAVHHPDEDTQESARRACVALYARSVIDGEPCGAAVTVPLIRAELAGLDLVCWCPIDQPCHADFLLEVANSASTAGAVAAGEAETGRRLA